jgi:hypothetical protein
MQEEGADAQGRNHVVARLAVNGEVAEHRAPGQRSGAPTSFVDRASTDRDDLDM